MPAWFVRRLGHRRRRRNEDRAAVPLPSGVDLLHIDDVGAEKTSEWVLEQLYALINARYEDERALVITTNLDHERLREQITPRTVSRLIEICGDPLPLYGRDRRMDLRS